MIAVFLAGHGGNEVVVPGERTNLPVCPGTLWYAQQLYRHYPFATTNHGR